MKLSEWLYFIAGLVVAFIFAQYLISPSNAYTLVRGGRNRVTDAHPTTHCGPFAHWRMNRFPDGKIPYSINQNGSDNLTLQEIRTTTEEAFDLWSGIKGTGIDFRFDGYVPNRLNPNDGKNVIFWDETGEYFAEYNVPPNARTQTYINAANGEIIDADIILNGYKTHRNICLPRFAPRGATINWTLTQDGCSGIRQVTLNLKLKPILSHEIGHLLGVSHSILPEAVMYSANRLVESLHADDRNAIRYVYPVTGSGSCTSTQVWAMSGNDPQRTGLSQLAGSVTIPSQPQWIKQTISATPVVGDISVSKEDKIYFANDRIYALNPDGTEYAPSIQEPQIIRSPIIDDVNNLIYVVAGSPQTGWDLIRFTKNLQNRTVVYHGSFPYGALFPTAPIVDQNGTVYMTDSVSVIARGSNNWISTINECFGNPGLLAPTLGRDGSLYITCNGGGGNSFGHGLYKLDSTTGARTGFASLSRGSVEPIVDYDGNVYTGYVVFNGVTFSGEFIKFNNQLQVVMSDGSFTSSRATLMPDGTSTVRFSYVNGGVNSLIYRGITNWQTTLPAPLYFTSTPSSDAVGKIFIGASNTLFCINAHDGSVIWNLPVAGDVTTQPAISRMGLIYIGTTTGKVYAF